MVADVILATKGLIKEYPLGGKKWFSNKNELKLMAVKDVTLEVEKGKILGIVGESGCGKSTLARLITQLIPATDGEVYFKGDLINPHDSNGLKKMRRSMQMIFQDPYASLNPRKRVIDLLVEPLEIHNIGTKKTRTDKALSMLEKVGLQKGHAKRFPHEFSGGQCQRINIARALMLEPELLICDEPVSALDVSIQAQVINLLLDLQEQLGLTYIFISHDLNVVRYFCDDIAVMYGGEIVEYGVSEEVYLYPKHSYTKQLLEAIPGKREFA